MNVTAIIPALNEAENIGQVVAELLSLRAGDGAPLIAEVIVADNGSDDDTAALAIAAGAVVIHVPERGYGYACAAACAKARGDVLLFVDGDRTADLSQTPLLLNEIQRGAYLVIGARRDAQPGSLTPPQRFGNALACALVRLVWRVPISDLGPFRAIRRDAYETIAMQDRSYGWTIEMQIRATQLHMHVVEVPITWLPRVAGQSKVSGTLRGVIGAGVGILSMIARLWAREREAAPTRKHVIQPFATSLAGREQSVVIPTRQPSLK